jgi:tetratricopeptide (TPR) repeat protein
VESIGDLFLLTEADVAELAHLSKVQKRKLWHVLQVQGRMARTECSAVSAGIGGPVDDDGGDTAPSGRAAEAAPSTQQRHSLSLTVRLSLQHIRSTVLPVSDADAACELLSLLSLLCVSSEVSAWMVLYAAARLPDDSALRRLLSAPVFTEGAGDAAPFESSPLTVASFYRLQLVARILARHSLIETSPDDAGAVASATVQRFDLHGSCFSLSLHRLTADVVRTTLRGTTHGRGVWVASLAAVLLDVVRDHMSISDDVEQLPSSAAVCESVRRFASVVLSSKPAACAEAAVWLQKQSMIADGAVGPAQVVVSAGAADAAQSIDVFQPCGAQQWDCGLGVLRWLLWSVPRNSAMVRASSVPGDVGDVDAPGQRDIARLPPQFSHMEQLAAFLQHRGLWAEALSVRLALLEQCVAVLGRDERNVTVLMCQHYVGMSLWRAGQFAVALSLQQHTHCQREAVLGPAHLDTVMSLSSIAIICSRLSRHAEAVDAHRRVLAAREAALGRDHIMAIYTRVNMATPLLGQGSFAEAYEWCSSTLSIMDGAVDAHGVCRFKEDHPERLRCLLYRGAAMLDMGRYADVVREEATVVQHMRRVLGHHHPFTLNAEVVRAKALTLLGRYNDAQESIADVIDARKRALGERHTDYITTLVARAELLRLSGELEAARSTCEAALRLCGEASLDGAHELVLGIKQCIADTLMDSDARQHSSLTRARGLLSEVVAARSRTLRETHPALLTTKRRAACLSMLEGEHGSAIEQLLMVISVAERPDALGPRHPDVVRCRVDLAVARSLAGVLAGATAMMEDADPCEMLRRARDMLVDSLGPDHPDCARVTTALERITGGDPMLIFT